MATGTAWQGPTENVGPRGCQVVAPRPLPPGTRVQVALRCDPIREPLVVAGRVAWVAAQTPHRAGIAFVDGALPASTRWFERVLAVHPALAESRRIASHLPLDAMIYLGRPPAFVVDFSPDEVRVLRHVASGVTLRELRRALRDRGDGATRAIFSLLARKHVTLARGASVHPDAWRTLLAELETSLAVEALGGSPLPRMRARAPHAERPVGVTAVHPRHSPEPSRPESRAALRRLDAGAAWSADPEAQPVRPPEAQGAFERALTELAAGRAETALILLRRARALSPGDPEIGRTLAEVAFRHGAVA